VNGEDNVFKCAAMETSMTVLDLEDSLRTTHRGLGLGLENAGLKPIPANVQTAVHADSSLNHFLLT